LILSFELQFHVVITDEYQPNLRRFFVFLQLRNLSLPVQREAIDAKLVFSDLMVDMLKQFSDEDRGKRELETQKGSIQKVLSVTHRTKRSLSFELAAQSSSLVVLRDLIQLYISRFSGYLIVWKSVYVKGS